MADDDGASSCSACGQPLHPTDHFCPECGHKVEVVDVVEEPTEVLELTGPAQVSHTRRNAVIAAVAAIGVILAGAAWWGMSQQSAAKDQYQASAPALMSNLDDMAGVQSTEMVQDVAGEAQSHVTAIDATLQQDPQAKGADRLNTLRDAFVALAALQAYEETNTDVWDANRAPLLDTLGTLGGYGGETQEAVPAGEDAVRTLDDLTARVDKAMARYRKQVAKAKAAAKSQRVEVREYHVRMESLIDRYTSLRNDTGAFVERMRNEQLYMYEISDYFTQAATDRREIGNQTAALRAPAEMRGVHSRIVTVIGDGADAIDAAVAALEDAECFDGECFFEFNSQWEQFQSESDRITARYGQAYDAWQAAMDQALREARGSELPPKPDL